MLAIGLQPCNSQETLESLTSGKGKQCGSWDMLPMPLHKHDMQQAACSRRHAGKALRQPTAGPSRQHRRTRHALSRDQDRSKEPCPSRMASSRRARATALLE